MDGKGERLEIYPRDAERFVKRLGRFMPCGWVAAKNAELRHVGRSRVCRCGGSKPPFLFADTVQPKRRLRGGNLTLCR
jgi:hypothetical protein